MSIKTVKVIDLVLWSSNPRNMQEIVDEKDIIKALFTKDNTSASKQYDLAKDILIDGLVEVDLPILVPIENQPNKYTVYEGNRRVAALKSVLNPSLLDFDKKLMDKFKKLQTEYSTTLINIQTLIALVTTRESALKQIDKLHNTKGRAGIYRETWGSQEKEYFDNVVDEKATTKKTPAYYILNKYKDKFRHTLIDELQYTSMNRLLGYGIFKNISGIKNYEKLTLDQIELIQYYFDQALIVEKTRDIKISRFRVSDVKKYIEDNLREKYEEILTRKDKYIIQIENLIEIYCDENIIIAPTIIEKETEKSVLDPQYQLTYFDKEKNQINKIDTSTVGKFYVDISYKTVTKRISIIISKPKIPEIKLVNYDIELLYKTTYNLRNNISPKSINLNIDDIKIMPSLGNKVKIANDVFTEENDIGEYYVEYYYKDKKTNIPTSQKAHIIVKKEEYNLFNITPQSVFSSDKVYRIHINNTVSSLISQTSNVFFDDFYYLVASSFRTIIELLFIHYIENNDSLILSSGLKSKITIVINDIKTKFNGNGNIASSLCAAHDISFEKYKSFINDFDQEKIDQLYNRLNFFAHTSGTMMPKKDILDFGRTTITNLIILVNLFL